MKIYHGSNYDYLDYILEHGISPRKNKESNWEKAQSHPDMVYLSTAYPFYFSYCSTGDTEGKGVVFEVELESLNETLLYPDEDFIWHVLRQRNKKITIEEVRDSLEDYAHNWELSIQHLGNCCYKGKIKPNLIQRYCVVDFKELGPLAWTIMDPTISVLNYRFCEEKYRGLVSWLFGDLERFPTDDISRVPGSEKHQEFWEKETKDRKGISIITL